MDRFEPAQKLFLFGILFCTSLISFSLDKALAQKTDIDRFQFSQGIESNIQTVSVIGKVIPSSIKLGGLFTLQVIGRIDQNHHIYSIRQQGEFAPSPTKIVITSPFVTAVSKMEESATVLIIDEAIESPLQVHQNDFWISRQYRLNNTVKPGMFQLTGYLFYQICNNKICSLPLKRHFSETLNINTPQ
ncbi:MAG: hypothetical protein HQ517_17070 [SAR324 cluster bacterium]|nr:hypothetical protein [SAR324 cluster bacterium]